MSYGRTTAALSGALVDVLGYRKVNVHLGAANGMHPASSTLREREQLVALILRLRRPVLSWASRAAQALPGVVDGRTAPTRLLVAALDELVPGVGALPGERGPSIAELGDVQARPVVEAWRRAAAAAVDGLERDLPALVAAVDLTTAQRLDLVRDVTSVVDACLVLDERWSRTAPGWQPLGPCAAVRQARRSCRQLSAVGADADSGRAGHLEALGTLDPAVDRTPAAIAAALAAHVTDRPQSVRALRRVLHDGVGIRRRIATLAAEFDDRDLHRDMNASAVANLRVLRELRNVGSLAGGTGSMALSARLSEVVRDGWMSRDQVRALGVATAGVDRAVSVALHAGIADHTYLGTWRNRLSAHATGGVRQATPHFEPITTANHPGLLAAIAALAPDGPPVPLPGKAVGDGQGPRPAGAFGQLADEQRARQARPQPGIDLSWPR